MGARYRREMVDSDRPALAFLTALTLVIVVAGMMAPRYVSFTALLVPMFVASLWLGPRMLPWFTVFVSGGVAVLLSMVPTVSYRTIGGAVVTFAIALLIMGSSFRRSRLGVSGPRGESMFVDLRDRISKQGNLPSLPPQWYVESVTKAAGGTQFAGDFVVASRTHDDWLDVVVVDVSGKGIEAGSRSLFLSGAFNGILAAVPASEFLASANDYLLRQNWDEGFATAIHLHLDLASGDFELRKAGHPPAVWLHAGSGRWSVLNTDGPVLGLIPDTEFECLKGNLALGDGLLMYTDGLVETADRDISLGIDKLAGLGERLFQQGFEGGAKRMIDQVGAANDDRALVLVHRRWQFQAADTGESATGEH